MPIQWPPVDRYPQYGTDCDVRDFLPVWDVTNLGIIGADLSTDSLDPGIGINNLTTRAVNLRNFDAQFEPPDQYTMAPPATIFPAYGRQSYQQTDWYRSNSTLVGVTRDSTGAVLGNVEVVLYSTIDVVIGSQYSDASGNFSFQNPGTGPFYIVAYKTGAPDVAGTTVNTLLPTLL
jgi:hypothetical protein